MLVLYAAVFSSRCLSLALKLHSRAQTANSSSSGRASRALSYGDWKVRL